MAPSMPGTNPHLTTFMNRKAPGPPTNQPKSSVFIIEVSGGAFEKIAGVSGQALKGELWRKGEIGRFGAVTKPFRSLTQEKITPLFMSHHDLAAAWIRAREKDPSMPEKPDVQVHDLMGILEVITTMGCSTIYQWLHANDYK